MPYLMHIARALLVALVGALATVAINRFDKYNREKNEDTFQRPPWENDFDDDGRW
jgi:hypothetical protein